MKRHLVFPIHFDSRASALEDEGESWTDQIKTLHRENKEKTIKGLELEFGLRHLETKIQNFRDLGNMPFSIVSYHNGFFQQARNAFVAGSYYPAATGACALAERILNHLIIDLRADHSHTPEFKTVYRKDSFDDWNRAVKILNSWNVLRGDVPKAFLELGRLRNRLIHFDQSVYAEQRACALEAIRLLAQIVSSQFGFFRPEHWWAVKDTRGAQFICEAAESDPFIKRFYLPSCPKVGPYYAVDFIEGGVVFFDRESYPDSEISDEEFASLFAARKSDDVVESKPSADVRFVGFLMNNGRYVSARRAPDGTSWTLDW
ncbi:hypothetical protein [Bradyrhizobium sp. 6(2017)]|uniref:hypothetical protein n=1 Tax=Bradyrhizobium sp. 6(2017) TaxID=1197460 RepID=UPI0013E1C7F2|nr:hypothetical protein [Bradyrhizobium sp. 6(2017)]QIG92450.1 hypothetical protein G6P99_07975 [Bradyrhizobium sp. 6(2017)]